MRVEQGEAWFQVAKDKQRPFVVAAGRARIRAVGTAFSVRRRAGGADVLVTEGAVEVWADGAEGHRVRLSAGARGFIADDAAIVQQPAAPSAIDRALAWRSGKVDLAGDRLDSAVAEFNRYNQRRLVIADPAATIAAVRERIGSRSAAQWNETFAGKDVCCNLVKTLEEALHDPQFRARGVLGRSVLSAGGEALPAISVPIADHLRDPRDDLEYPRLDEGRDLLAP